jgi:hypothetical protein
MIANAPLPLSSLLRRILVVAVVSVLMVAAMTLSASGASARTRACPHLVASAVNLPHSQVEHAGVCLVSGARTVRHLPVVRLPGGKL